jgi:hypothetical protein
MLPRVMREAKVMVKVLGELVLPIFSVPNVRAGMICSATVFEVALG